MKTLILLLCAAVMSTAAPFSFTYDTSALAGSSGAIDFLLQSFTPPDPAATVTVTYDTGASTGTLNMFIGPMTTDDYLSEAVMFGAALSLTGEYDFTGAVEPVLFSVSLYGSEGQQFPAEGEPVFAIDSAVPEPGTLALLCGGLAVLALRRLRP